jgi:spiro-SPASM protein
MKACILDALFVTRPEALFSGKSALDQIVPVIKTCGFERLILVQSGIIKSIPDGVKNVVLPDPTPGRLLQTIEKESKQAETIVVVNAGSPFFDKSFLEGMLGRHEQFVADYTTGIGYPEGLVPSIVQKEIIRELVPLVSEDTELTRDWLFHAVSKDINAFDIETILSEVDLRLYRLSIGSLDDGEVQLTSTVADKIGSGSSIEQIVNHLESNRDDYYTTIYMTTLQLTTEMPTSPSFLPALSGSEKLTLGTVKKLIPMLQRINSSMHVVLGGNGEPLAHPDIESIIQVLTETGLRVIVETYGQTEIETIKSWTWLDPGMVWFVVALDASTAETYTKMHPGGSWNSANELVSKLLDSGYTAFRKVTRVAENELEIESFIRNGDTENLIIRKYSSYCGTLPDRVVVDLSPLKRIPCFHLRRELFIAADGSVPICQYCPASTIGSILESDMDDILSALAESYRKNAREEYETCCSSCDDYYIFNF